MVLRLYALLILFFVSAAVVQAQTLPPNQPEQDACGALQICGGSFYTPFSYVGGGQVVEPPGCFNESGALWLRIQVATAGNIVFTISPLDTTNDYDFAMWNITATPCSTLASPIRCNGNTILPAGSVPGGIVGLNYTSTNIIVAAGTTGNAFNQFVAANVGDVFLILVDNFSSTTASASGFTIDFAGSTATFTTGNNPVLQNIKAACSYSSQAVIKTNRPVKCSSITATGSDFVLAPSGTVASATGKNCVSGTGYTDEITVNFASPLPAGNYTLGVKNGTDGNTLLDICNNAIVAPSNISFTVAPTDFPTFQGLIGPACAEMRVKMTRRVACDSLATNGSDFALSGNNPPAIVGAYGLGCSNSGFTDTLVIKLAGPFLNDGNYTLLAKIGSDNNTLIDSCNNRQAVGDALNFNVNSYDGVVDAQVSPTVLCEPGYVQLTATGSVTGAPQTLNQCGATSATCAAPQGSYFAAGKDSLSSANSPFYATYPKGRQQYLYRATELKRLGMQPGLISELSWNVTAKNTSAPLNNFNIKMSCTGTTQLSNTFLNGAGPVYTSPAYNTVLGANTFVLQTPFYWDGNSNILVEVCYDNNSTYGSTDVVAHSVTPFPSVYHVYSTTSTNVGCTLTGNGTSYSIGSTTFRPKILFNMCSLPLQPPVLAWQRGDYTFDSSVFNTSAFIPETRTFTFSALDGRGCFHRDTTRVVVSVRNPAISPFTTDTTICPGDRIRFTAANGTTYSWISGDLSTISCLDCPAPILTPVVSDTYSAIITDALGCSDTLDVFILVKPKPQIRVTPKDTTVKAGKRVLYYANGGETYNWMRPVDLSSAYGSAIVATARESRQIIVTGIDTAGCQGSDTAQLNVDFRNSVFVPSAFTPNGDGNNDFFSVQNITTQKLAEFRVFNRWGNEVFSTNNTAQSWDGLYKSEPQPTGDYGYIIRLAAPDGLTETYTGTVTLIR
jgi:gliding motility-associated-like protein